MRYKGCTCVSCNNIFTENDDAVVCPVCGSPHHRECWKQNGKCANTQKHSEDFVWIFPEELREKPTEKKPQAMTAPYKFKNGENAVVCPHCNTLNYGNDVFCMKCRKPLFEQENIHEAREDSAVSYKAQESFSGEEQGADGHRDNAYTDNTQNSYNYDFYQKFGGMRPDTLINGIPAAELADYLGEKKSGVYIRKFATMERFGKKVSFSICALLFGPIWYLYRKMYKEGFLYLGASIIIALLTAFCSMTEPVKAMYTEIGALYEYVYSGEMTIGEFEEKIEEISAKYSNILPTKQDSIKVTLGYIVNFASLALLIVMVLFADYLYMKKTKKDILAIREECTDMPTYRRTLCEKGGVSVSGAVIGVIGEVFVYIAELLPAYFIMFGSM